MRRGATSHLLSVLITLAVVALPSGGAACAVAADPGAPVVDPQQKQITDAIAPLSPPARPEREEATPVLWAGGDAGVAALTEAGGGDDVEVARRAPEILRNLHYGIRPD